ncbi:(2Fe-2S)-binding protein [Eleftheria terrae]|uniref:(2Fe-2S)-binding protein n=1 Tax=Eleftheria terrae TaxID=1597781 RepID=UPI00263ACC36|nr:(2Fe-2S)-binding protein [Eleftheria terrae]WKB53759.1 (2Fe-2S)-binding protein [Eleftheria terrae]
MIVCVCRKVSDRDIERAARAGCASFDDLQMELGVATCCGRCAECAQQTLESATHKQTVGARAACAPRELALA